MSKVIQLPPHNSLGALPLRKANKKRKAFRPKRSWLDITKEYNRLRKTPRFREWSKNQFLRQVGTCYYCHLPIYGKTRQNTEHVMPRSLGGDNRWANLVLACAQCNKDKGTTKLSYKERQELREINKKKKGTYLKTRERYPTETDISMMIRSWL